MVSFRHKIHGDAMLLPNEDFIKLDKPTTISYRLKNCSIVRHSSLEDAGLSKLSDNILIEYGYKEHKQTEGKR